jgi:predicted RNase H-like nuclease (RuvC/YqgF family)
MRESLYIQRLWNAFMRKKMEREMKQSHGIDEAFKAIKTATGVTDVQEMVRKFLTREQTYSQLLMNVSESERHIDKLKKDNEELRSRLHELKIDAGESGAGGAGMMDEEIIELNQTLSNVQKDYSLLQEKFKKINIVNDQVSGWAKKAFTKFSTLLGATAQPAQAGDIVTLLGGMNTVV